MCNYRCCLDNTNIKLTFGRIFTPQMMASWYQLDQIVHSLPLKDDIDALIWQYDSKGVYSSKSLYSIINFRGVEAFDPLCVVNLCPLQSKSSYGYYPIINV